MEKIKIHIGETIKDIVRQRGLPLAELAREIGISRQKLNGWLKKDDISVKDLFTISSAVGYDFFKIFNLPSEEKQETKVILHIEVEKGKVNDVLAYIEDKQLYNILKR